MAEKKTVEETEVKEEKVVKTEEKTKKREKGEKSLASRIINVVLWIVLFAWMALVFTDFMKVHNENEPKFCWWNKETTNYDDGTVSTCTGLGYKVINYKRESFKAIEFGPFWIKDRTAEESK